jgi:thymidine kinase
MESAGYLELIIGPMFSSKTTALLEIYKKCQFCSISVTIINHTSDTRYDDKLLSSHDKVKAPCLQTNELKEIWPSNFALFSSDVILINEGQFFPDLYDIVITMLDYNKKIYICGLDGDFDRKKFGQILDLIPYCDKVNKLHSICSLCRDGTMAIFSMRLTDETEQTVVGSNNYIPVCRKCYTKNKL